MQERRGQGGLGVLIIALSFVSACNHLFYFPDAILYSTPEKVGVDYDDATLTEADGTKLALWWLHAQGPSRGTVVHFHGNAQNMTAHFLFVAWLTKAGFDVVTFDYRGYGISSGNTDRAGFVADGRAVLDWVRAKEELKSQPIFVFGQSLGGALAIPAVVADPRGIRALVVESTFDSYRHIARGKLASFWLTWPLQYPLSFLVTDELSPVGSIGQLQMPFLSIHGDADPAVPIEYGKALFAEYRGKDKEFWLVPGGEHTPAFAKVGSPYEARLLAWLTRH